MAKIEMDISEYEVMKENKKLLEDSLEKERQLGEEIKVLQQEKVDALEKAKHSIVTTVKRSSEEILMKVVPMEGLKTFLKAAIMHCGQGGRDEHVLNILSKKLFKQHTVMNNDQVTHDVSQSIEDFKYQEKERVKEELKEEYAERLANAKKTEKAMRELVKENKTLTEHHSNVCEVNNGLIEEQGTERESKIRLIQKIENIIEGSYGFWSNNERVERIKKAIKS